MTKVRAMLSDKEAIATVGRRQHLHLASR